MNSQLSNNNIFNKCKQKMEIDTLLGFLIPKLKKIIVKLKTISAQFLSLINVLKITKKKYQNSLV